MSGRERVSGEEEREWGGRESGEGERVGRERVSGEGESEW